MPYKSIHQTNKYRAQFCSSTVLYVRVVVVMQCSIIVQRADFKALEVHIYEAKREWVKSIAQGVSMTCSIYYSSRIRSTVWYKVFKLLPVVIIQP